MEVTWSPRTKREKQVIKEHGGVWRLVSEVGDKALIEAPAAKDLRWIMREQIHR